MQRNKCVNNIKIILAQIILSAPKGGRTEANWNGGVREGTTHGRSWGTIKMDGTHMSRPWPGKKGGIFLEKGKGQCGWTVIG